MMSLYDAARRAMQQNLDAAIDRLELAIDRYASAEVIARLVGEVEQLERQAEALDCGRAE
jgi:hypothetical protein